MKTKNRRSIWLCCSVIQAKDKKKNKSKNSYESSTEEQTAEENIVSQIFGQKDNNKHGRFTACICCSVIDELPPSHPRSNHSTLGEITKNPIK
ncbi:hypothetical protein Pfo_005459 [Paulownia fortunei]|nr:hypothetical protein Pfo_005459 [Paulownia fortunei]